MSPRRDILLDTGPLVAVLDASDAAHQTCVATLQTHITRLVTSEAVVTESCHLVARGGAAAHVPLDALLSGGIPILALDTAGHRQAARFMARYADLPMDYADATLLVLAEVLDMTTVFTLDVRGFSVFRRASGEVLTVLPVGGARG